MPRTPKIERSVPLTISLPETLKTRLELWLWSEAEGRVPLGAYQKFFVERITEYFSRVEVKRS